MDSRFQHSRAAQHMTWCPCSARSKPSCYVMRPSSSYAASLARVSSNHALTRVRMSLSQVLARPRVPTKPLPTAVSRHEYIETDGSSLRCHPSRTSCGWGGGGRPWWGGDRTGADDAGVGAGARPGARAGARAGAKLGRGRGEAGARGAARGTARGGVGDGFVGDVVGSVAILGPLTMLMRATITVGSRMTLCLRTDSM